MHSRSQGIGSADISASMNSAKSILCEPIRKPTPVKPPFRRNVEQLLRHNAMPLSCAGSLSGGLCGGAGQAVLFRRPLLRQSFERRA
jgi:hypothetical protein